MEKAVEILIIDDEKVIRDGCERALRCDEYNISKAENGQAGIDLFADNHFDIVLLDLMMPGIDGFEVLAWIKKNKPAVQVIVVTGFATVSKAVNAMKQGAFDFVGKPFTTDYIRLVVSRAIETQALAKEAAKLREEKALDLETIAEGQSRLKTVFNSMSEAVILTNSDSVVVHHNSSAINILEIQTDPVVGKPFSASIINDKANNMLSQAMQGLVSISREFPPGSISRKYLNAHCSPVKSQSGKVLGSVTVFQDITAIKEIDKMKSEFVAMVAHELRTPLASVEQMIYALDVSCTVKSEQCEHLHKRMTARTKELLQLIENLLNLSKLEAGVINFQLEKINGDDLILKTIEMLQSQAENKGVVLDYQPSDEAWYFNVDYDHMKGAIINLIGNSIKYTPSGGKIFVSSSKNSELVKIIIRDTGIGIEKDSIRHIFDRFFRVKGKETRGITGSGLGLSLVKKVVDSHKGFIDVQSVVNQGTTFTLSFPLT